MSKLSIDVREIDQLQKAMKDFQGNTEKVINEVLHEEASPLIQDAVRRLMPKSNRKPWKGKPPNAKDSKSLTDKKENLAVTVKTTKKYQYLYFTDDGTNVRSPARRKAGNKQYFLRGAESQKSDIVERCIGKLVNSFND